MQNDMATFAWQRGVILTVSSEAVLSFDIHLPLAEVEKRKKKNGRALQTKSEATLRCEKLPLLQRRI